MLSSTLRSSGRVMRAMPCPGACLMPSTVQRRLSVAVAAFNEGSAPAQRTFVDFSIYKGKAAVQFKVIPPTFASKFTNGEKPFAAFSLDKEGVLLLEFANAQAAQGPQSTYGMRNYDWSNKITFALKPLELAQLTDFDVAGPPPNASSLDFMHDPNKGSNDPNAVKTIKTLKLAPSQQGDGYMLSIVQKMGNASSNMAVPVSRAEYVVLKHLAAYLVPRLYGFDLMFENSGNQPISPDTRS